MNGAPASDDTPAVAPAPAPKPAKAARAAKPAAAALPPEPVLDEVSEIGVRVRAEVAPGVFFFITGVSDDGRVFASDNAEAATPMHTADARELLANKAVRAGYPTAQIVPE